LIEVLIEAATDGAKTPMRKPFADDRAVCDLTESVTGAFGVAIAHDLGVFRALRERPRTAAEVGEELGLDRRPCAMLLTICVAAGLAAVAQGRYALTPLAADYLVEESPYYAGDLFRLWSAEESPFAMRALRRAIVRRDGGAADRSWIERHDGDPAEARAFTKMMHGHSMAAARAWPEKIDLSGHARLLDLGGGSGAHAIGAALRWPHLEAVVLDLPSVCASAEEYVDRYGLRDRVRVAPADFWRDAWPEADVHFFSDVFHNWTAAECRLLARRSFDQLPRGGSIAIHEMLLDDDGTGPFTVAASSLAMLAWCGGQQYTAAELAEMLADAGFDSIAAVPSFGYWSLVTGRKR
jgi:hypothetical protein